MFIISINLIIYIYFYIFRLLLLHEHKCFFDGVIYNLNFDTRFCWKALQSFIKAFITLSAHFLVKHIHI